MMIRRQCGRLAVVFIVFVIVAVAVFSIVSGRPFRMSRLPDGGTSLGCGACHVNPRGGGKRNPFGQDYETVAMEDGDRYTPELGGLDSDGDGFTNDQEFSARTHPGDSTSRPTKGVDPQEELSLVLKRGEALFNDPKLGTTGSSCNSCHPGGGSSDGQVMGMEIPTLRGAAATFPKYKGPAERVITLEQMDNLCIEMIMEGEPLKLGGDEAVALAAYVTSLSNGEKVQVGER